MHAEPREDWAHPAIVLPKSPTFRASIDKRCVKLPNSMKFTPPRIYNGLGAEALCTSRILPAVYPRREVADMNV
jgi:hypothetical protein